MRRGDWESFRDCTISGLETIGAVQLEYEAGLLSMVWWPPLPIKGSRMDQRRSDIPSQGVD
jgi:hypothetical protein